MTVTDEESIKAAVKQVADAFGRIDDILINNAGVVSSALRTTRLPSGEGHRDRPHERIPDGKGGGAFFKAQRYGRAAVR